MSNKRISKTVIVAIIIVILAISAVAVYFSMSGNEQTEETNNNALDTTDNTPTEPENPDNNATENTEPEDTTEQTGDISTATSLQFKVGITPSDAPGMGYKYSIKNAGTSNMKMRVEVETMNSISMYVLNSEDETAWLYVDDQWTDLSDTFPSYWETYNSAWEAYKENLLEWSGTGDYTYITANGDSIRIYNIDLNPDLPDTMFQVTQE